MPGYLPSVGTSRLLTRSIELLKDLDTMDFNRSWQAMIARKRSEELMDQENKRRRMEARRGDDQQLQ